MGSPKGGVAIDPSTGGPKVHDNKMSDYAQSKGCNVLLAKEYQKRYGKDGVVSNAWNPGNLSSELQRHQNKIEGVITESLFCHPVKLGGYTELFAGWSPEPGKSENKDRYIGPWGRFVTLRPDIGTNEKSVEDLWSWCERETAKYK